MSFSEMLKEMGACTSARAWVGLKGLSASWRHCPNGYWMWWLIEQLNHEAHLRCCEIELQMRGRVQLEMVSPALADAIRAEFEAKTVAQWLKACKEGKA